MQLLPASAIDRFLDNLRTFTNTQPSVLSLCHKQSRILNWFYSLNIFLTHYFAFHALNVLFFMQVPLL